MNQVPLSPLSEEKDNSLCLLPGMSPALSTKKELLVKLKGKTGGEAQLTCEIGDCREATDHYSRLEAPCQ